MRPTGPIFVDTSALYAALDADDENHPAAAAGWRQLLDALATGSTSALTHSGVLTETAALVQRRLGMAALRSLLDDIVPLLDVVWVDERMHRAAAVAVTAANQRYVSLVDWTSFLVMRDRAVHVAFAFDADFTAQGFDAWT